MQARGRSCLCFSQLSSLGPACRCGAHQARTARTASCVFIAWRCWCLTPACLLRLLELLRPLILSIVSPLQMDGSERLTPQTVARLVKELKDLIEKPPEGITVRPQRGSLFAFGASLRSQHAISKLLSCESCRSL